MLENVFALIIVISFVSFTYFFSKLVINKVRKKDARSFRKNAIVTFILFVLSFIGFGIISDEVFLDDEKKENEKKNGENNKEPTITWDDLKDKEKIVGKSDKDFKKDIKSKPGPVRHDNTGNWKMIKLSKNIDMKDYALSYSEQYIDEEEIHFIVNLTNKTTTKISKSSGLIYVDYYEYIDKEEHDAKVLGSGMHIGSYIIYPDGDIEDIFNTSEN